MKTVLVMALLLLTTATTAPGDTPWRPVVTPALAYYWDDWGQGVAVAIETRVADLGSGVTIDFGAIVPLDFSDRGRPLLALNYNTGLRWLPSCGVFVAVGPHKAYGVTLGLLDIKF